MFNKKNKQDNDAGKGLVVGSPRGGSLSNISSMRDVMDRLFNEFESAFWSPDAFMLNSFGGGSFPKINVKDNGDSYEVKAALAGYKKEDITVELDDNVLFIKGNKQEESEDDNGIYIRRDITSRSFSKPLAFKSKIVSNPEEIKCTFEDGVLVCVLKKEEAQGPDSVKIDIK